MSLWVGSSRTPIGLDVGQKMIKAVQLSGSPGRWRLEAVYSQPRPNAQTLLDPSLVKSLSKSLAGQGFIGRQLVLAVPHDRQLIGHLELPPRQSQAPLDEIAHHELARLQQVDAGQIESACWDLPAPARSGTATHVMAVGCAHEQANALLDTFESQGWAVVALDVHALALARACASSWTDSNTQGLILDIGWGAARLAVVHGGTVIYQRVLADSGIEPLVEKLATRADLGLASAQSLIDEQGLAATETAPTGDPPKNDPAGDLMRDHFDAMAEELRISIAYTSHRYPNAAVAQLVLVGGGALMEGLADFLTQVLEMKVTVLDRQGIAQKGRSTHTGPMGAFAAAWGLAAYPDRR